MRRGFRSRPENTGGLCKMSVASNVSVIQRHLTLVYIQYLLSLIQYFCRLKVSYRAVHVSNCEHLCLKYSLCIRQDCKLKSSHIFGYVRPTQINYPTTAPYSQYVIDIQYHPWARKINPLKLDLDLQTTSDQNRSSKCGMRNFKRLRTCFNLES